MRKVSELLLIIFSFLILSGCASKERRQILTADNLIVAGLCEGAGELEVRRYVVGASVERREIECVVIGEGEDVIFIIASIHGNESVGTSLVLGLVDYLQEHRCLLDGRKVVLLPVASPDSVYYNCRFNARGVDLNRNFATANRCNSAEFGQRALSEPESRIIKELIEECSPDRIVSIHQGLDCIDYDGPGKALAERMAEYCSLPVNVIGSRPGSLGSYAGGTLGIPIITFEIPWEHEGFNSERLWEDYGVSLVAAVTYPEKVNKEKEMAKDNNSSAFLPKPLDDKWNNWLVGEWEGWATSDKGEHKDWIKAKCGIKIESGLNGQFLIYTSGGDANEMTGEQIQKIKEAMGASDEEIERLQESGFKEMQFHTIDPKTGERIGHLFDSWRCVAKGTGRLEGNKEIMEWEWSSQGQGATSVRIIEKISEDKFTLNHKYTLPDGSKMEDKIEMTRKAALQQKKAVRFNMVGLFVNDLQKTIEFYRDVIGLEVKVIDAPYAEFKHEGISFAVFERAKLGEWLGVTPAYPDGLNGTFELALELPRFEDVDREFDRVVKAGAKPVTKPKDTSWGQRSSVVADPDGNLIEIGSFNRVEKDK